MCSPRANFLSKRPGKHTGRPQVGSVLSYINVVLSSLTPVLSLPVLPAPIPDISSIIGRYAGNPRALSRSARGAWGSMWVECARSARVCGWSLVSASEAECAKMTDAVSRYCHNLQHLVSKVNTVKEIHTSVLSPLSPVLSLPEVVLSLLG